MSDQLLCQARHSTVTPGLVKTGSSRQSSPRRPETQEECKLEVAADLDREQEDGDTEVEDRERGRIALPGLPQFGEPSLR